MSPALMYLLGDECEVERSRKGKTENGTKGYGWVFVKLFRQKRIMSGWDWGGGELGKRAYK